MADANNAKIWSHEQELFIDWLARPKAERRPKTQQQVALEIGVDPGTLSDWKHLPGWYDAVNTLSREYVKHDIPDVLGVVRSRAKKGELAYVNMVLAMAGMSTDVEAAGKGPVSPITLEQWQADRARRRADAEATMAQFEDEPDA